MLVSTIRNKYSFYCAFKEQLFGIFYDLYIIRFPTSLLWCSKSGFSTGEIVQNTLFLDLLHYPVPLPLNPDSLFLLFYEFMSMFSKWHIANNMPLLEGNLAEDYISFLNIQIIENKNWDREDIKIGSLKKHSTAFLNI